MNVTGPIHFYNRYTEHLETEAVYGGGFLKWAYGNPLGRVSVELLVKRAFFSYFYGWWMDRPSTVAKVKPFVESFGLDAQDFAKKMDEFTSFNDFFSRELKSEARPIADDRDAVVFPADGRHLGFQDLSKVKHVFVKGQSFDLAKFIGDADLAKEFAGGSILISRLCPVDYHRYHFPVSGQAGSVQTLDGSLRSVSPLALRRQLSIFWENRRARTVVDSSNFGKVVVMEVGATCVGGMHSTFEEGAVVKGAPKGYFSFGGSCVTTIYQNGAIQLDADLLEQATAGREVYAKMGEPCGVASRS